MSLGWLFIHSVSSDFGEAYHRKKVIILRIYFERDWNDSFHNITNGDKTAFSPETLDIFLNLAQGFSLWLQTVSGLLSNMFKERKRTKPFQRKTNKISPWVLYI